MEIFLGGALHRSGDKIERVERWEFSEVGIVLDVFQPTDGFRAHRCRSLTAENPVSTC